MTSGAVQVRIPHLVRCFGSSCFEVLGDKDPDLRNRGLGDLLRDRDRDCGFRFAPADTLSPSHSITF